jgi:hypothetical protein
MSRNEIKVDHLEIRLKGGDPSSARELGASIGEEVLQQIGQQVSVARSRRSIRIAQIDAGTLRLEGERLLTPGSRRAIAGQIAARVGSKLAPNSSGGKR